MTIYHKDAKRSGYASPKEVAALKVEIERTREILIKIIDHPFVSVGVEDGENADFLQIIKEARTLVAQMSRTRKGC